MHPLQGGEESFNRYLPVGNVTAKNLLLIMCQRSELLRKNDYVRGLFKRPETFLRAQVVQLMVHENMGEFDRGLLFDIHGLLSKIK